MGTFVVRQPNGRLALFSTIVDNFTWVNMTNEDVIEVLIEDMGRQAAEKMLEHGLEDWEPHYHGRKGDGLARWRYAINMIRLNQGQRAVSKALSLIYGRRLRRRLPIERELHWKD